MGNKQANCRHNYFSQFLPEEQAEIDGLFAAISGGLETLSCGKSRKSLPIPISLEMLKAYLGDALPEKMTVRLYDGMRNIDLVGTNMCPADYVTKEQFVILMSNLLKGSIGEKSNIIMKMLHVPVENVKASHIRQFTEDLITSVVHVLDYRNELKGWNVKKTQDFSSGVKELAIQLFSALKRGPSDEETDKDNLCCDNSLIEDWLLKVPQISTFLNVVIRRGFLVLHSHTELANFIPECKDGKEFMSLFNIPAIIYINSHLPIKLQYTWKRIFSSQIHGCNFAKFCGNIIDKGPCLLVVKDRDGHVFGGFSSHSWAVKGQFQGDSRSFLFTISPNIAVYTYSGYNDHYMYLNHGQQTIPNGLGMGGQFDYFGLWIDYDFGKGHSKAKPRCSTYNSPQLSAKENFEFDILEVWAVGDICANEKSSNKKTVLDSNIEAHCLLEMVGKSRFSDGLRDPCDDEETDE
ncbi:MTOR-associated protein MEAK7 [Phascolarctos cinereus]|uniref:MTOR-associated protein MEAK7 n=1 Tax=Phascolarctos cinereus TaxID=38626 RepID=A0A6P5KH36_PHACI|nr:TLD domain-containing protein 1 [Phascolarctos cinereus]XP_020844916.1 TLD domain-containing protein 1 [Phascolarctos cinereus]XP_020844917.1 TLD domain-containing protein 1 [Phascolarctos cinereus]XP_020844918.1 TLD domain-containing protein 1 [Phascolarctos cinereus]